MRRVIGIGMFLLIAFALQAQAEGLDIDIKKIPFAPKRVVRLETIYCYSLDQIQEAAQLTLAGNSDAEVLMEVNLDMRVSTCEKEFLPIWAPVLRKFYSTDNHVVAIYRVMTAYGARFMFLSLRRFRV